MGPGATPSRETPGSRIRIGFLTRQRLELVGDHLINCGAAEYQSLVEIIHHPLQRLFHLVGGELFKNSCHHSSCCWTFAGEQKAAVEAVVCADHTAEQPPKDRNLS